MATENPASASTWQLTLTHPHFSAQLGMSQLMDATGDGSDPSPVRLNLGLTSAHPVLVEILQALGPVVATLLPILLVSLLGGKAPAPAGPVAPS